MPVSYAGTVAEHTAVRTAVGLFDVSHLGKASVTGPGAAEFVNSALTTTSGRIGAGQAQYTLCCTADGGVVDDLIAYYVADDEIFLVAERGEHRDGGGGVGGRRARGRRGGGPAPGLRGVRGAGAASAQVLDAVGLPAAISRTYMALRRRRLAWRPSARVPHAGTPANTATSCCRAWDDARGRCSARCWPRPRRSAGGRRAGRPRHPAHRDGLPAARPGPFAARSRPLQARQRLGRGLGQAGVLGPRRAGGGEGGGARAGCGGCGRPAAGCRGRDCGAARRPGTGSVMTTSGTFSPTLKAGIALAFIDTAPESPRRRGGGRRARPAAGVHRREAAVRAVHDASSSSWTRITGELRWRDDGFSQTARFSRDPHPRPPRRRHAARDLAAPGFGKYFTDHMVAIHWTEDRAGTMRRCCPTARSSWTRRRWCCTTARRSSRGSRPTASPTASIASFRPEATPRGCAVGRAAGDAASCPTSCSSPRSRSCSTSTASGCPPAGGEESMYLRPFMFATEVGLGVRPADEYLYCLIASPGRRVLPAAASSRSTCGCARDYIARRPGRHRRRQVRRQLRGLAARAGAGRRAGLRPGGLARRRSSAAGSRRWAG